MKALNWSMLTTPYNELFSKISQTGQDDHHVVVKEEFLHLGHANRGNIGDNSSFPRLQHVRL